MLNQSFDEKNIPFWNKNYIILLVVNAVAFLSFQILIPLIPIYGLNFTSSESLIGFLAASISVASLLIRPVTGMISDRFDQKKVICIMQIATAVVIIGYIFSSNIQILILIRFLQGLVFGVISTVVYAAAVKTIPKDKLGRGLGIMSVTAIGSQAVAPAIGIYIADNYGYPTLFIFVSVIAFIAGLLALILTLKNEPIENAGSFSLRNAFTFESLGPTILTFLFVLPTAVISSFLVLFSYDRGIENIAQYFTIYAIILVVTRIAFGGVIDKYPFQKIAYVCAVFVIIALVLIATAHSFFALAIAAFFMGIGYGFASPTLQTEIVRRAGPERNGPAMATYFLAVDISFFVGPISMGYIIEYTGGYDIGYFLFCIPAIVAIPLAYVFSRTGKKD